MTVQQASELLAYASEIVLLGKIALGVLFGFVFCYWLDKVLFR